MNKSNNARLYAYLKQQKAAHTERFTSYDEFRRYYKSVFTALTSKFQDCSISRDEAINIVSAVTDWLHSLAPVKTWDKKTGEPASYYGIVAEPFDEAINEWFDLCEGNKDISDALASIALPDDHNLTVDKAKPLLWNFLYSANHTDLKRNIKSVCEWFLQCKGNLSGDNYHHHPLLYVSRDREDGSMKGGNGKSVICKALVDELSSRGLPCDCLVGAQALPGARSEFISDAYGRNLLLALNELPSVHHVNESTVKAIFEDSSYTVRKMRTDPYSAEVTSMFIGTTNYQDWFSTDSAFASRLHLVNVNADLNLRDRSLREAVNKSHPLPSQQDIADAFLTLLRVPEEVFDAIIAECEDSEEDTATDLDVYTFSKLLKCLKHDKAIDLKRVTPLVIRDELKVFEDKHRKWALNQKVVNEILNKHFGNKGVQYFHGKHLTDTYDLTDMEDYRAPDFDARLTPLQAYCKVYDALHPSKFPPATDPDDFGPHGEDKESDDFDFLDIPQSNAFFDSKMSKPSWDSADRDDFQLEILNPIDPVKAKESIETGDSKTGCKDSTVASMRNFVFECDDAPLDWQIANANRLKGTVINRAVHSGGKSIHCRATIDFEPKDLAEYKRIWKVINEAHFAGLADPACANPSRKTRHPNGFRYDKDAQQEVLFDIPNCVFPLSKCGQYMRRIEEIEEAEDFEYDFVPRPVGVNQGDGARANSKAVRHFLDTPFLQGVKHGGDAHSSIYKAVLSCIGGHDQTTLDEVIVKAKREGWKDSEIRGAVKDAERHLAQTK